MLASMYFRGQGVALDQKLAADWALKSALQGAADAQLFTGQMYLEGVGQPKDERKAAEWFDKAALQGNVSAQMTLGSLLEVGHGVTKDIGRAARLYRSAADTGYAVAQYHLGMLYAKGTGVPLDYGRAEELWKEAADQGFELAKAQLVAWRSDVVGWNTNNTKSCDQLPDSSEKEIDEQLPLKAGSWKLNYQFRSEYADSKREGATELLAPKNVLREGRKKSWRRIVSGRNRRTSIPVP